MNAMNTRRRRTWLRLKAWWKKHEFTPEFLDVVEAVLGMIVLIAGIIIIVAFMIIAGTYV